VSTSKQGSVTASLVADEELYERSVGEPEAFWSERAAATLAWDTPWERVVDCDFAAGSPSPTYAAWFAGGRLNATYNCVDRHVADGLGERRALVFAGADGHTEVFTYADLLDATTRFANVLKSRGVVAGDRVILYLPMIPELPIAMLACARLGAVHAVVFAGFSSQALRARIDAWGARVVVTSESGWRGAPAPGLKGEVDRALGAESPVETVVVVARRAGERHDEGRADLVAGRDLWWHEAVAASGMDAACACESLEATEPLFILSTSGSAGAPKGVVHAVGGYLLYAAETFRGVFAPGDDDVHFCAADIGWITGHTYLVYGPLAVGATTLLYEGTPGQPEPDRLAELIVSQGVTTLYTTPPVVHAFMAAGERWAAAHPMPRLKAVATVGDPLSPEAWDWCRAQFGAACPVLDTWWQTETGGIVLAPWRSEIGRSPVGSRPFFGVAPLVLRNDGQPADARERGNLCLALPWPGMMTGIWCDAENVGRFRASYFARFPGLYYTGDQASVDEDGRFHIEGSSDDDVWVLGERLSSVEVERALLSDTRVVETAVVGYPEPAKGEAVCCYVVLRDDVEPSAALRDKLAQHVGEVIGPFAVPDRVHFVAALPRTRSGKMIRRILRKIAEGDPTELGDTTMLADPSVVTDLVHETRPQTTQAEAG
jgi:acetyl-CoA synthetase